MTAWRLHVICFEILALYTSGLRRINPYQGTSLDIEQGIGDSVSLDVAQGSSQNVSLDVDQGSGYSVSLDFVPFDIDEWEPQMKEAKQSQFDFAGEDRTKAQKNLCIDGHLAPEFFLIGAQKAATTSFSVMLSHPHMVYPTPLKDEPNWYQKELHIFDDFGGSFQKGKNFWLSHYPTCNTTDARKVATDFTPNYLFQESQSPLRMKQFYGPESDRLKFAVILRNPAARIQSAFYFMRAKSTSNSTSAAFKGYFLGQANCVRDTFQEYVGGILSLGSDPCDFLKHSDYAEQLKLYFQVFRPSQFMIIPFQEVVAPQAGSSRAALAVWKFVGLHGRAPKVAHMNDVSHPLLQQDLGPDRLKDFQSFLDNGMGAMKLAKVLVDHGVSLFGQQIPQDENPLHKVANVAKSLEESW